MRKPSRDHRGCAAAFGCFLFVACVLHYGAATACAQFTAAPPSSGSSRVTAASLKADDARPAGQCPVTVRFNG